MSDLSGIEKAKLEKFFEMGGGYVLDFTNRSFTEFFFEHAKVDIYRSTYTVYGGSKANLLRGYWNVEDNVRVGKIILKLLEYWRAKKELSGQIITFAENNLADEVQRITDRLLNKPSNIDKPDQQSLDKNNEKGNQLNLLLKMFDELALSHDYQRRGFLLQDLLKMMFFIHEIPVNKSFQRNDGGEQIDGAFSFQGWYYLVECKWTKKLADIRELDSLTGKVNRSGKQTMGLFLSIEGWSENVPKLLKQNPEKCIILMEGYDLRSVLDGLIPLEVLLNGKLSKLNIENEPYFSARELMK